MAFLYHVVYGKSNKEGDLKVIVQATTVPNAWAAVQTADPYAKQLVSATQAAGAGNIIVGS